MWNKEDMAMYGDIMNKLGNDSWDAFEGKVLTLLEEMQHNGSNGSHAFENTDRYLIQNSILIIAYGILIIISVFGNTLVCHVIFKNKRLHTVTNFFIANLAISDLLLTFINVPFNIARYVMISWPFGELLCHLVNFSLMVSVYVSTYTLTGIALDRQQVLLYPLSPRISKPMGWVVIALIWIVATGFSLPFGLYTRLKEIDLLTENATRCRPDFPDPKTEWEHYLTIVTILLQYVVPLSVIGITYGRIVHKLWVRTHLGAVTENQQASQAKAKRKSIKMLISVVIVFALCWMPLNLYQLLIRFHPNASIFHSNSTAFFICHWIAISSTCYNPFVYCWLNEAFRSEVKDRFRCCFSRSPRIHPGTEIDGMLLRADRAYRAQVRSIISATRSTLGLQYNRKQENTGKSKDETDFTSIAGEEKKHDSNESLTSFGSRSLTAVPEEEATDLLPKSAVQEQSV